jgi:hypothetical protein
MELSYLIASGINAIAILENKTANEIEEELGYAVDKGAEIIRKYKSGKVIPKDHTFIHKLAIDSVKRGYKNKEWLFQFLNATNYPFKDNLLNELFPSEEYISINTPSVKNNLPSPSYSKFVMRYFDFDTVVEGIKNRSAIVVIRGLGGNGKTSLAREIASQCISSEEAHLS